MRSALAILLVALAVSPTAHAQDGSLVCGSLENAYGPFDYTNPTHFRERLPIVEAGHFDSGVEQLIGHQGKPGREDMLVGDLDYTLRAFPNHHRALYTMSRYFLERVPRGDRTPRYSMECYFDRAIRLAPHDAVVRMLQGIWFLRNDEPGPARDSFAAALEMAPQSAEIHYNAGLLYIEFEEFDRALHHAHRAYELGYPLMGLRNRLERLGHWRAAPQELQSQTDSDD